MNQVKFQGEYNCHNEKVDLHSYKQNRQLNLAIMPKPEDLCSAQSLENSTVLKRYLARRTRCTEEAADLYQESVVRVLEQAKKSAIANPVAYAISIARNLLTQRPAKTDSDIDDLHCNESNPESKLEESQRIALIYEALELMPEQRRRVFELRRIHGESREDIALQLGISSEAVTRYTTRAMTDIQRYLEAKTK